jgi:CYTH domain-containing protein
MSVELERELTFLINELPADLAKFPSKIIEDNYVPRESKHPVVRIRRNGDKLMITKKQPANTKEGTDGDATRQTEHTIPLTRNEYDALSSYDGKKFIKRRFAYEVNGHIAELDVYLSDLTGLAVIDFEFDSDVAMANFQKPEFVGADISHDETLTGGMLCGKTYTDIAEHLRAEYGYEPVQGVGKYQEIEGGKDE